MSVEAISQVKITEQNKSSSPAQTYKTEPYPNDSVELLSNKDKKNTPASKVKQYALTAGGMLAALTGSIILLSRHHGNQIAKLYEKKLIISNLPEKLEFKEAKTIEEGIKFAKEILGIKEIDKDFSLDAINTANRGLVDVSNANKGKLFMPTRLGFQAPKDKNDDYLAFVVKDIDSPNFGNLVINKNYFDEKILDKEIKDFLYTDNGSKYFKINEKTGDISTFLRVGCVRPFPSQDLMKLVERFYLDPSKLNIYDKQKLFYSLQYGTDNALGILRSPLEHIKKLASAKKHLYEGTINIDEVSRLSNGEQAEVLKNMVKTLEEKSSFWKFEYNIELPETTIYHEMGHLQDFARNLKELDVKQWKINFKQIWKDAWHKTKTGEDLSRAGVDEVDNRWGTVSKEYYEKLLKNDSKKFKKLYPDLYEFITNQNTQQIAGKVSSYAQSGIGEFIAETYRNMISGHKIPDDVMQLYRKYKGPELPV